HAQGGKDAGVFQADHARADNGQRPGQAVQAEDVIATADLLAVEGDVFLARDFGARGDNNVRGRHIAHGAGAAAVGAVDLGQPNQVRLDEGRLGGEDLDLVAHQLVARYVNFVTDNVVGAEQQVLHGDVLLDRVGGAVQLVQAVAAQVQHRFTQRLAGNGAAVD